MAQCGRRPTQPSPAAARRSTSATVPAVESRDRSPLAEFGATYAHAYCDNADRCCRSHGHDPSSCLPTLLARMRAFQRIWAADSRVAYDPAAGARCIEATAGAMSACTDRDLHGADASQARVHLEQRQRTGPAGMRRARLLRRPVPRRAGERRRRGSVDRRLARRQKTAPGEHPVPLECC
jgi:hypothetical protein